MPNTVSVLAKDGLFFVQLTENGKIYEREFSEEKHARSWAAGQQFRLLNDTNTDAEDLARSYNRLKL